MVHEIENFFGVYLLYCTNPKYKGHTYIGFTVDPNRRVMQHNKGTQAGGAKRTSGRGPWDMVMIVHGFPNKISALRFEWAWQNPHKSKRLKHVSGKKKSEKPYEFRIRVMTQMVRSVPWNRLPLTIRWLKQEYKVNFDPNLLPPTHMPIAYGPVRVKKVKADGPGTTATAAAAAAGQQDEDAEIVPMTQSYRQRCAVCKQRLEANSNIVKCPLRPCSLQAHTLCLAKRFLGSEGKQQIMPVEGQCPKCHNALLWGDIIRFKMGCYQNLVEDEGDGDHWADQLQFSQI